MKKKILSLTEMLVATAIVALLASILFPVFAQARVASLKDSKQNLRKIARAARMYGADYDDMIPITVNGHYRSLLNVPDGSLTRYGEQRTDMWPLIMLPYVKDRTTYVDPTRGDVYGIYGGPPLAPGDAGYNLLANTFRNQNRFSFYGMNYIFLSPVFIPNEGYTQPQPTDFMVAEAHGFFEADDPSGTIFFTESTRGYGATTSTDNLGTIDPTRGFSLIDPPGMWNPASTTPYVTFWTGTYCSGDWCGDADVTTPQQERRQNFNYMDPALGGNNVAFLDGHIRFMSDVEMASGTNYLSSTPNDYGTGYFGGGAVITDKSHYLWNLDSNYHGR